jgi:hypothetical protein
MKALSSGSQVGQAEDTYVILVKRQRRRQYCPISIAVGRKQADARVLLLQAKRPGKYLLFNLPTKITAARGQS